jgi:ketosteroid isomerase-like protein
MLHPRNLLLTTGFLLLLFGGWWSWHLAHPPLSDKEQIAANIEGIREAVEARNARQVASYLAPSFTWGDAKKSELQNQMVGGFLQWRDVTANVTGLHISIDGDTAVATGKYSLALRPNPHTRPEAFYDDFEVSFEKQNGNWLIVKAKGGMNVP